MVFPHRKPPLEQDYRYQTMNVLPGVKSLPPPSPPPESMDTAAAVTSSNLSSSVLVFDDQSKKIRKPYTITKSRENWTDIEHDKFLEALHLFDRDWKKIEAFIGSKTAIQIRSHAQKYFLKVQKSGTNEHVPPPRPKRKASHPYPHKAPKNAVPKSRATLQSSAELLVPVSDLFSWPENPCSTASSTRTHKAIAPANVPTQDDMRSSGAATPGNCCSSSIESGPGMWPTDETNNQQEVRKSNSGRVVPDFAKVYRFIGSIFDPNASGHLQKLKTMDPVDVETVVLLMKNLSRNLKSPQFECYRSLFSSYDTDTEKVIPTSSFLKAMPGSAIASS